MMWFDRRFIYVAAAFCVTTAAVDAAPSNPGVGWRMLGSLFKDGSKENIASSDQQKSILLIGAGLPRTGTLSFITALDRLGLNSYHVKRMMETPGHVDLWYRFRVMQEGNLTSMMDRIQHEGFNATYGLLSVYYKELMEEYPDALVILTVRSEDHESKAAGEAWAKSIRNTVANVPSLMKQIPFRWIPKMRKHSAIVRSMFQEFASTDRTTGDMIANRLPHDYDAWNDQVKSHVPAERLLVFAAKDGWEPLCRFLSPLHPEIRAKCDEILASGEPYPRVNEMKGFRNLFLVLRTVTFLTYAVPVMAAFNTNNSNRHDNPQRISKSLFVIALVAGPCVVAASYMLLRDSAADVSRRESSVVKFLNANTIATDGESQYPDYSDSPYCSDKGPLLDIIRSTGVDIDHHEQRDIICSYLPKWSEISALYGDEPKIIGLERCQEYRDMLKAANQTANVTAAPIYPMPRVAGLQNCGTTALADTFFNNLSPNPTLHGSDNPRVMNVPWRKHTPWHYRYNITSPYHGWVENKEHVLPVVVVRDPYRWMASMCKINYNVHWERSTKHCPNLVPYPYFGNETQTPTWAWMGMRWPTLPNPEIYDEGLIGLWNEWNREYLNVETPRLIVRFEDTLFHAEKVFQAVAECAGIVPATDKFERVVVSAKDEATQKSSDMLSGLKKAGTPIGRTSQMIVEDIQFAKAHLDPDLMEAFGYVHPEDMPEGSYAAEDMYNRTHGLNSER
ncbi:hypothetical protein MPSEU_000458900 [Mayamaea pseudoterrestris]|nr:hypothetical protein MPSEU_000458900 [Mayamaea pseudoterrestris]